MILSHDTTVFTTDPRVEVLGFMVVDGASVDNVLCRCTFTELNNTLVSQN